MLFYSIFRLFTFTSGVDYIHHWLTLIGCSTFHFAHLKLKYLLLENHTGIELKQSAAGQSYWNEWGFKIPKEIQIIWHARSECESITKNNKRFNLFHHCKDKRYTHSVFMLFEYMRIIEAYKQH